MLCKSCYFQRVSPHVKFRADVCCLSLLGSFTPANTFVAAFHFTIALLPGGPSLLTHPPVWYKPELIKTEKELEDEEAKALLARNLRENKKSKKKKAAAAAANGTEAA